MKKLVAIFGIFFALTSFAFAERQDCKEGDKESVYVSASGQKIVIDCEGVFEEQKRVDELQAEAIAKMKANERYLLAEGKY